MKILVSGASGFIGTELINFLETCGHKIVRLVRDKQKTSSTSFYWNPAKGEIDISAFDEVDAVINLAGENIAGGRWNTSRKQKILESRIQATNTLSEALSKLKSPPKVFISASAVGFYGNRGDSWVTEDSTQGSGFLADVCSHWEAATAPALQKGIRTVFLRIGIVLSTKGGALAKMLLPFKLGFGGALGSGDQYMSWISIDDLVAIFLFALTNPAVQGPVNAVAPNPVTNKEFTKALGKELGRSTFLNTPAFALRFILGKEMADEFLLSSTRAEPLKLTQEGYSFLYPELAPALKHIIRG